MLQDILKQVLNVKYVEYTHGPFEKGADFVVERHDEALGTTDFIGVVAKCDKILMSFSEVERQIDECGHPRKIRGGLQTVRLPEVWVITSKTISQNAKDKIEEKFSSKKVRFFESDWLVRQIDEHAPHFWEEIDGTVGKYLGQLDKRLGVINAQTAIANTPAISAIQMELDVEELEVDRYVHKKRPMKTRLVNMRDEVMNNKVSVIEAEMGFGKSYLARKIAIHFTDVATFKESTVLPVYSTFKIYADSKSSLEDFLRNLLGIDCFDNLIGSNGRLLLILDGVDEALADPEYCKAKVDALIGEVKAHDHWSLVLTSRPWKALDEFATQQGGIKRYRIRPLSFGKIIAYLRQVFDTLKLPNRLVDDLAKSGLFKQLPHNPIAASLLANIIKQEKYELPSSLTELYAKTVELMLGRWDERREISTEKQYKASERLARLLARHMIDNQLVYMSRDEIKQMFKAFLADRQTGISLNETFDYLINRSTLFGVFEDTDAVFFKHRSFAEYLYAKDAYESRNLEITERAFEAYWQNTYFFYLGIRSECPDLIDALVKVEPKDLARRVNRLLNMGNYMLAGYETPYVHVQAALDVILVEAARVYLDIRHGRVPTGLTGITEMQLLWYFTEAIRACYGYDFFKKALPLTMAKIDEVLTVDDEARPYALFFAACSLADVEDTCGFTYLLEHNSATNLPIQISFALMCEMNLSIKAFANTKPVKDFDKKLKKVLKISGGEKLDQESRLRALFHEPLSAKNSKSAHAVSNKR
ncbi:NACHT domain-containing protein [Polaromonas sp. JS666]|nr:NACHT domain-containing protein [Polaromonas sp. JS666]